MDSDRSNEPLSNTPYPNNPPYQNQNQPQHQNQGYQNQGQGYQNQGQGYQNQGYQQQPGNGRQMPPPPPPNGNPNIVLPSHITAVHPHYTIIMEQARLACPLCSYIGPDLVTSQPGCAAIAWAICLYFWTGIFCFWIPLISSGCQDVHIRCSRCRHLKYVVEKPCF